MEQIVMLSVSELEKVIEISVHRALETVVKPQPCLESKKALLSRKEAAEHLNISLSTLHEWTKQGIIIGHRINSRVLYKVHELQSALKKINAPSE